MRHDTRYGVEAGVLDHALHMMPGSASRPEAKGWSVTIDTDNLRLFFRARYFLAGVLIGAVAWLVAFLAMD